MDEFKKYHDITKEITLDSKIEEDRLYVYYSEKWIPLTYKKRNKFYAASSLQSQRGFKFCRELGLTAKQTSSKEYLADYYRKNKDPRKRFEKNRSKLEKQLAKIWCKRGLTRREKCSGCG